jgi:hypothetical protein
MRRPTWLDRIVYAFQHRWETNAQFRAMASGLVGLVVILILCSCMGLLNATADSALTALGLGGSANVAPQGTPNTGTNQVNGYQPIPTPTVVYPTGVVNPVATIPDSQTPPPVPSPTNTPVATDTPTGGGGGGGGGGGSCSGAKGGTSWSFTNICPPAPGQSVTFTLSAPGDGNSQVQVHITCGTTLIGSPSPFALPASGVWSQTVTLAAGDSGQCTGFYQLYAGAGLIVIVAGPVIQ